MEVFELLKKIVQIKSPTYGEKELHEVLAIELKKLGFTVNVQHFSFQGHEMSNVIAHIGKGDTVLVFNGHTDVVETDPAAWKTDPFTLHEENNILYGAGIGDMKASVAAMITAASAYIGKELNGELILAFTADEERTGTGVQEFVQNYLKPKGYLEKEIRCLIGEPSGTNEKEFGIFIGHRGVIQYKVTINSHLGGHGSRPFRAIHPLEILQYVVPAIKKLEKKLQKKYISPILAATTISFGSVSSGISADKKLSANVIPETITFLLDCRVPPELYNKKEHLTTLLQTIIEKAFTRFKPERFNKEITEIPQLTVLLEYICSQQPTLISKDDYFVDICAEAVRTAGFVPHIDQTYGATDAPIFNNAGIPTVTNLGPGNQRHSHKPNECVEKEKVKQAEKIYGEIIKNYFFERRN